MNAVFFRFSVLKLVSLSFIESNVRGKHVRRRFLVNFRKCVSVGREHFPRSSWLLVFPSSEFSLCSSSVDPSVARSAIAAFCLSAESTSLSARWLQHAASSAASWAS